MIEKVHEHNFEDDALLFIFIGVFVAMVYLFGDAEDFLTGVFTDLAWGRQRFP
jgi:hypothetical protein